MLRKLSIGLLGLLAALTLLAWVGWNAEGPSSRFSDVQARWGGLDAGQPGDGIERPADDSSGRAPDFALPTLEGDSLHLSDHWGKVIVLNFWATWCGPCREEIPRFVELQQAYGDEGVQFLGVSVGETRERVRPFAEKMEINYPLLIDEKQVVPSKYGGVPYLPSTFVINRDGIVERYLPGMVPEGKLEPVLKRLLRKDATGS